ncbi:MAG: MoaD/ThiS family protein [Bacillota bacterium]|jgi:sulfur carrier protein|nr:MoaD/ThiS family protein [Bacillota bacterium]
MDIEVKLFAYFRIGRWISKRFSVADGVIVKDILKMLSINENEIGIVLINGTYVNIETPLKNGDILAIFPPAAGG